MLQLSSHVLRDCHLKYGDRYRDPHRAVADGVEVADACSIQGRHLQYLPPWSIVSDTFPPRGELRLTRCLSVCGISIARIYFFYQAGKGFDNDYDVTCE